MNIESNCRTLLVEDIPADTDAFSSKGETGPHARVANAIAELVESQEPGGKMIGLEGVWGSGKSTVVNFLGKKFDKPSHLAVVYFDAWAHEGDPLRRTFLETLISQLQDVGWLDKSSWKKELDSLANRRKVQRSKSIPQPTLLGALFALASLTIPLGITLLKSGLDRGITLGFGLAPNWLFITGILFSISPFVVLLGNIAIHALGFGNSDKEPENSHWAFLASHTITENKTETLETPNPTSIEFEGLFASAMSEALSKDKSNRLLLVLDNLDRVDPEHALEIWSTLQTFLQDRRYQKREWFHRLWMLVPYDPTGLRKLWDGVNANETSNSVLPPVSNSFFDKSFQLRFYVPPPILSDWKDFLLSLLAKAFPDHDKKDFQYVYQMYERCGRFEGQSPTPRELKVFVNQIGGIHRQWKHQFPMSHVAYFVLCLKQSASILHRLLSTNFPESSVDALAGGGLRASLAGLAFNVKPERGMEILLSEPIRSALVSGDAQEICKLKDQYGSDFWAVLEYVATNRIKDLDSQTVVKVAVALDDAKLWGDENRPEKHFVVNAVCMAAKTHGVFMPVGDFVLRGMCSLINLANDKHWSAEVLGMLLSSLEKLAVEPNKTTLQPVDLLKQVLNILQLVVVQGHEDVIPDTIMLPFTVEVWHSVCPSVVNDASYLKLLKYVRPKADFAEVSALLEQTASNGTFDDQYRQTLFVTNNCGYAANWNAFTNAIRERLDASINPPCSEIMTMLPILWELANSGRLEATSSLKALADNGHLLHYLHKAMTEGNNACAAMCIYGFLRERPSADKPTTAGNSDAGFKMLTQKALGSTDVNLNNEFLSIVSKYGSVKWLFGVIVERKMIDPIVATCLKHYVDTEFTKDMFDPEAIINKWTEYRDALNDSDKPQRFTDLIGKMALTTDLKSRLQVLPFSPDLADLYTASLFNGDDLFAKWCQTGIEALATEAWLADWKGKFATTRLALKLNDLLQQAHLSTAFADAMALYCREVASGRHLPPNDIISRWDEFMDGVADSGTRKVLTDKIIDTAINMDGKISQVFFALFQNDLNELASLHANDRIVSHLFSPIVRERNVPGLVWLNSVMSSNPQFLDDIHSEHTVQEFQVRIHECLKSPIDGEAGDLISSLANRMGIVPEHSTEDKTSLLD